MEGEKCSTKIASAEQELKGSQLKNESLITSLNDKNCLVGNLEKMFKEKELNSMHLLWVIKRVEQDVNCLEREQPALMPD